MFSIIYGFLFANFKENYRLMSEPVIDRFHFYRIYCIFMLQFRSRCPTFSVCLSRFFLSVYLIPLRLISQQLIFNLEISFSEPKTAESIAHCGELLPRRVSSDFYYFFLFSFPFFFMLQIIQVTDQIPYDFLILMYWKNT